MPQVMAAYASRPVAAVARAGEVFLIRPRAAARSAEIFIYGDIGESWYGESVTAAQFVRELAALDVDQLTVRLNSFGGSVPDGLAIYNAIRRHPAQVTVCIDGVAASIASLIAMAGDTVEMADNALLMVHAPWGSTTGNSTALRDYADLLDTWAQAMAVSYASKTGKSTDDCLALLCDGVDHWYSASEAQAFGFIDQTMAALPAPIAAAADWQQRFPPPHSLNLTASRPQAATAAPATEPATPSTPVAPTAAEAAAIRADTLRQEQLRRRAIQTNFAHFQSQEGVAGLQARCEADPECSPQAAAQQLLAHLAQGAAPVAGGRVQTVADETDQWRAAASESLLARAGLRSADGRPIRADGANPCRGLSLLDLARASLQRAGHRVEGLDKMALVAAAFTQSSSDFPVLLENTLHKALQNSYATAGDTWSRFCRRGTVSDFREHKRYRLGSLGNLAPLTELGEFASQAIPDGERSRIAADTKGYLVSLSRQMVINDDLEAFVGLAAMMGRSARRTLETDVYALLQSNPVLDDGQPLFSAAHGNLASAAAPSVAAFEAARVLMAQQMDVSKHDYLDLRPAIWLGPIGLGGEARVINGAEYDPDSANKLQRPNKVRGLFADLVDTPRLTSAWYAFADPNEAPVLEVAFLDGNDTPYLELENGFSIDGARYKVRLDYGVAAIDYRGATMTPTA
ncbi:ClpP-like prohead protease/major capsid protein fusion protein [Parachitinimonas caeni]|uniref:ATP-dependent Clp protease proteolytic subunit n=1 Tax=Parachitinimonas caeni TaxID=3031301 RepID=A0ABT7DVZ1_9NEIS|nr:ClpP-like prohead protease/major capsid protein fusion protein [Parachitinimonas caeni]MDK2124154.1 Clp protease ClpP [Parachitinimonas caeni]